MAKNKTINKQYHYDHSADSLYIVVGKGKEDRFEEIAPGISLEFNKKDQLIGVEVLNASRLSQRKKSMSAQRSSRERVKV